MPIGILGSLVVCTILYDLVLTRAERHRHRRRLSHRREGSLRGVRDLKVHDWLRMVVQVRYVAILAGFSSVILVMLMGQSRVFYSMSEDGLVPKSFSEVTSQVQTPWKANMLFFVFTSPFAAFLPEAASAR